MTSKLGALPAAPDPLADSPQDQAQAQAQAPVPTPAPAPRRQSLGNGWGLVLITFTVVASAFLAFPTFIILAGGLPPALAAALIDNRPGRHASYCVLAANLAGIVPALAGLWFGGNSVALALALMGDVYVWLEMYGTAALGWVLIWLLVNVTEFVFELMARYRISKLQANQDAMIMEWGAAVAGAQDGD